MRTSIIFIALLLSVIPLHAQFTDWNRLESLPEGTELIVHTGRDLRCTLSYIDDASIECASLFRVLRINRSHVIAISLLRSKQIIGISTLIGAGAGAGAYVAGSDDSGRVVNGLAGAVIGGFGGWVVGHIIRLSPGSMIYVRP